MTNGRIETEEEAGHVRQLAEGDPDPVHYRGSRPGCRMHHPGTAAEGQYLDREAPHGEPACHMGRRRV